MLYLYNIKQQLKTNIMKNLNVTQIKEVKEIKTFTNVNRFHGNQKRLQKNGLLIEDIKTIVLTKRNREISQQWSVRLTDVQMLRELIKDSLDSIGTPYFKTLIEGNTGIYYASDVYGHSDYNKTRVFSKNEKTLKLMSLFNSIINRKVA